METLSEYLGSTIGVLGSTRAQNLGPAVDRAVHAIMGAFKIGAPLLICGNGGSACDAMHIAAELVGRFRRKRRALNAIALTADTAVLTAWANDYNYELVFARQVEAHGRVGGILLAISTSGNSGNVVAALRAAREINLTTIGLTGQGGGSMAPLCDILIDVPSRETSHIQEAHVCIYHFICHRVEMLVV